MTNHDKVREDRLRRMASRQGLILRKSRIRDPRAIGYGTFQLVDEATNDITVSDLRSLDEIEKALTED